MANKEHIPSGGDNKITMDSLTKDEALPEVQEHAINAVKSEAESEANNIKQKFPDFDPNTHETDAHGNPVLTKTGKPRRKRGAGSPKHRQSQIGISKQKEDESPRPEKVHVSSEVAATTTSAVLERLQCVLISDDMKYSENEREGNVKAWTDLYDYYGGVEVHPAAAVAADHIMIMAARAQKPKVQSKFKALTERIAGKLALWKGKKHALSNSRQNDERKNDLREKESGGA